MESVGQRKARPKRNKLFYKDRWLISRHLVIALRRAGVVCDIVVEGQAGSIVSVPTEGVLSQAQRVALALRSGSIEIYPALAEASGPGSSPAARKVKLGG